MVPKFRAWHKELKMMQPIISLDNIGEPYMYAIPRNQSGTWPIDEIELMQWTGIKDTNDVDLYELDIVCMRELGGTMRVKAPAHISPSQGVVIRVDDKYYVPISHDFQIIGNIYENKNLLEGSNNA